MDYATTIQGRFFCSCDGPQELAQKRYALSSVKSQAIKEGLRYVTDEVK